MDKIYADTVRLLLAVAPAVFDNDIFAMKGGTAINLFVQDMPRLSVDIDVVYLPRQIARDEAMKAIDQELAAIAERTAPLGVRTRSVRSKDLNDDWSLLQCQHAAELPALRWKLSNLETFSKRRPDDFASQICALEARLTDSHSIVP
ncbi:nucleotidyl transferase AbiEii/AbiGii toxin family protein [Paraburkholderia sp.]|uniref:nucleotidyl transferase AbiEii/AbiGii toxin family protein n=1 Tax=Paraburkholderia sp. TaxID=1926495 RepID=UPI003D6F5A71